MTDVFPSVEVEDIQGTTVQASANIGTVPIIFPVTPGAVISSFTVSVPKFAPFGSWIEWSINGTFYERIERREYRGQSFKQNVTQLWFRASGPAVPIQVIINFEPPP